MEAFDRLRQIVAELRQRCPWDKAQTFESLAPLTWEEIAELLEALEQKDPDSITEELGDVLLHVFFYAQMAEEAELTSIPRVVERLIQKLIARHPHVYGEAQAADAQAVLLRWEQIKASEKGRPSFLSSIPERVPPLLQAYRLQEKAAAVGFDWATPQALWPKLEEELQELKHAISQGDYAQASAELGDVLFVLVNLARHLHLNPEKALQATNHKFRQRFAWMEEALRKQEKSLNSCSSEELESYWQASKAYYP